MKKTYRRAASAAILCILLFSFASCASGSAGAASSYTASSVAALSLPKTLDEVPITAAGDPAAGNIAAEDLCFHAAAEGALTCAGYYEITARADGSGNIYYTDFDSLRKTILCSWPECGHDDETCDGYLPCTVNIPEIMAAPDFLILAYSGNPYYVTEVGDDALARIELRDLNGENARTICKFDANVQLDFNFACSESKLYALQTTTGPGSSDPQKEVVKIDLLTGEKTVIARLDHSSEANYYFVGIAEGKLFFKKSHVDEALLGGQNDGMISTADITKALLFELFTIDPGSGKTTEIRSWRSGETLQKIVGNSCFFINPGSIDRFDLDTHALKRVVSEQEFVSPDSVEQVYFADPYLIYNIHYPAEDPSKAVIKRFICNVETMELRESALTTSFRGISDPVSIFALTPRYMLVGCSIEEIPDSEKAAYVSSIKRNYALLDLEAFVQDRPDYAVISEE